MSLPSPCRCGHSMLFHERVTGTHCATRRGERIKVPHSRRIEAAREAGHWGIQ